MRTEERVASRQSCYRKATYALRPSVIGPTPSSRLRAPTGHSTISGLTPSDRAVLSPWREPVERLATPLPLANFCPMLTLDHSPVSSSPEILGGIVVFRGTRVPVQSLIDYLQDGYSLAQFLEFFPTVDPEDARDFLRLVRNTPP